MENGVNASHWAGLLAAPWGAWYIMYLLRWAAGPFGVFDKLRKTFFGVVILENVHGVDYHQPVRSRLVGDKFLECSRCTAFWVGLVILVAWWFLPWVVVGLGVMGAAAKIDDI